MKCDTCDKELPSGGCDFPLCDYTITKEQMEAVLGREAKMQVLVRDDEGKPTVWCDPEIADIVKALNDAGIATVASCSGHGGAGSIALADGRELLLRSPLADDPMPRMTTFDLVRLYGACRANTEMYRRQEMDDFAAREEAGADGCLQLIAQRLTSLARGGQDVN
jgi:hypothetical protein